MRYAPRMFTIVLRVISAPTDSILATGSLLYATEDVVVLGRGDGADVLVPDVTVSRSHARVRLLPGVVRIERLAEHNALFVDEMSVVEAIEITGDHAVLQLGGVVLAMQRIEQTSTRTTRPVNEAQPAPTTARFRVVWDAQNCTVHLDERALDLPPLAASFLGRILESADTPVHQWDLHEHLGSRTNLAQCASLVRSALRRRVEDGELDADDLAAAVHAALDAPVDPTDLTELLRRLIGNQRGFGYVARVGAMGVAVEQL